MKKDAFYFSHDSNAQNDPKIMLLIDEVGMAGVGIYWSLLECMRDQADFKIPIKLLSSYARRWNTDQETIRRVIDGFNLFKIEDEMVYSPSLIRRMEEREKIREIRKESVSKRYKNKSFEDQIEHKQDTNELQTSYKTSTKKLQKFAGKERKGKEINLKENIEKKNSDTENPVIELDFDLTSIETQPEPKPAEPSSPKNQSSEKVKKGARPKLASGQPRPPNNQEEVFEYFKQCGWPKEDADTFWRYYESGNWIDGKGNPVLNWKQKAITWMKHSEKLKTTNQPSPIRQSPPPIVYPMIKFD